MERIVVTRMPPGDVLPTLRAVGDVWVWAKDGVIPRDVLLAQAATATGLYTMLTERVDADLLDASPQLRVVSNMAVGLDNVDVTAARLRGIAVGHTPDVLTGTTADMAMALLLAVSRRLVEAVDLVRSGGWGPFDPNLLLGRDVHETTMGIIGRGRIGSAVADRAAGFGMRVISYSRSGGVPLLDLLREADHVVITAALNESTIGLIGATELRQMKPTATLVNVARGPIVDTDALVMALTEGWIMAAGLDVTDPEPLPSDHPLVSLPNCTVVPHLGSATHTARVAMAELAAANLVAGLRGEPLPAPAP